MVSGDAVRRLWSCIMLPCLALCRVGGVDGKLGGTTEQAYEVPRMLWQRTYSGLPLAMQPPPQRQRQAAVP